MTFTGNFDFHPVSSAARLWAVSLTFWALILSAAYTANLASFLVVRTTSLVQIKNTNIICSNQLPLCALENSISERFFKSACPSAIIIKKLDVDSIIMSLRSGECSVALTGRSTYDLMERNALNSDCSLMAIEAVTRKPSGFAVGADSSKCSYHLFSVLDLYFLEMQIDGFITRTWDKYLLDMENQSCVSTSSANSSNNSGNAKLSIKDIEGIFIFHAILSCVALLIAILKYLRQYLRNRTSDLPHHE